MDIFGQTSDRVKLKTLEGTSAENTLLKHISELVAGKTLTVQPIVSLKIVLY